MFVTSKFLFVHAPKTGGSFVSKTLAKIHQEHCSPPRLRFNNYITRLSNEGIIPSRRLYPSEITLFRRFRYRAYMIFIKLFINIPWGYFDMKVMDARWAIV